MVELFTPAKLTALNIDSIERALVFSALAMQGAAFIFASGIAEDTEGILDKIKFKLQPQGDSEVTLRISANLPFDPAQYAKTGGFAVSAVKDFIQTHYSLGSP